MQIANMAYSSSSKKLIIPFSDSSISERQQATALHNERDSKSMLAISQMVNLLSKSKKSNQLGSTESI